MIDDTQLDETFFEKDEEVKELEKERGELLKVEKRTQEQEDKLKNINSKRQGWYNDRVGKALRKEREAREENERLRQELEDERKRKKEEQSFVRQPSGSANRTIELNGKKFYTDAALKAMVESGEMTQDEAQDHWQERNDERIIAKMRKEENEKSFQSTLQEGVKKVLAKYPTFDPKHRDHNPNDPIYVKARDLMNKGIVNAWDAVEQAEEFVGKKNATVDRSEDFGVTRSGAVPAASRETKVQLSEWEQEQAVRFHTARENPATGKKYTPQEAIEKALRAKKQRQEELAASRRF